ncbi:TetR/AcrR family transcriptional regulator [Novosphingobium sp. FSW06-99]|uniref:TetR/AcrR family transcriptional regulator n=1 Tax=Novosphingobium sp. FSW06-99 TaxID=1739113 RepID=UPI000ACFDB77|nr:TetR/AcrR family transcriptional regulator [Novosphingobium sp. FSW06-99]
MTENANTVNIAQRGYHHGDLRAALVAEGLRLLALRDAESLSLREIARNVGVSATAVYRHFPDKGALMAALAVEGLKQLGTVQAAASQAAGGGTPGFAATGRAYVRFALDNPALFRLIFASPALGIDCAREPIDTSLPGELLLANAVRLAAEDGGQAGVRAVRAWALVHGLAMLMLEGQIPVDLDLVDRAIG